MGLTRPSRNVNTDEMSMGSVAVPRVKKAVQSLHFGECQKLTDELLSMDSGQQIQQRLQQVAQGAYPELVG